MPIEPGITVWLTGLSGAGKSTLASRLERRIQGLGRRVEVLDGDVVRTNLSSGLGFSKADRDANIRRIIWVCELLNRNGVDAIVAAISPYRQARDEARARLARFLEVYMECPIEVLAARDPKGLYRRAMCGEIESFTGVSDTYEPPLSPEVTCHSDGRETVADSEAKVMRVFTAVAGVSLAEGAGILSAPLLHDRRL